VPELPLDDVQRHALTGQLERVRMAQLISIAVAASGGRPWRQIGDKLAAYSLEFGSTREAPTGIEPVSTALQCPGRGAVPLCEALPVSLSCAELPPILTFRDKVRDKALDW